MRSAERPLACPRCDRRLPEDARLCPDCRMPLVVAEVGEQPAGGPFHDEARKIHPRYARGELVRVAIGRNLAEAELIKGLLLEQGIPSMLRRTGGFDVPDFLAAGPRDVLVPASGAETARELLGDVEGAAATGEGAAATAVEDESGGDPDALPRSRSVRMRLAAALLAALLVFGAIAGALWILVD